MTRVWSRSDTICMDRHLTVVFIRCPYESTWRLLSRHDKHRLCFGYNTSSDMASRDTHFHSSAGRTTVTLSCNPQLRIYGLLLAQIAWMARDLLPVVGVNARYPCTKSFQNFGFLKSTSETNLHLTSLCYSTHGPTFWLCLVAPSLSTTWWC